MEEKSVQNIPEKDSNKQLTKNDLISLKRYHYTWGDKEHIQENISLEKNLQWMHRACVIVIYKWGGIRLYSIARNSYVFCDNSPYEIIYALINAKIGEEYEKSIVLYNEPLMMFSFERKPYQNPFSKFFLGDKYKFNNHCSSKNNIFAERRAIELGFKIPENGLFGDVILAPTGYRFFSLEMGYEICKILRSEAGKNVGRINSFDFTENYNTIPVQFSGNETINYLPTIERKFNHNNMVCNMLTVANNNRCR